MNVKDFLVRLVTFLGGLYFVLEFVLPESVLELLNVANNQEFITDGFITVITMAFGLGLINIALVHGNKIIFARKEWFYSLVLIGGLVTVLTTSSLKWWEESKVSSAVANFSLLAQFSQHIKNNSQTEIKELLPRNQRVKILISTLEAEIKNTKEVLSSKNLTLIAPDEVSKLNKIEQKINLKVGDLKRSNFKENLKEEVASSLPTKIEEDLLKLHKLSKLIDNFGVTFAEILRLENNQNLITKFDKLMTEGLYNSLGSAMFSLLSVYIAIAAFKAFRIQGTESFLMMFSAVIVILGQTPFGSFIYSGLPNIRQWLMEVPNSAAFRAITIGSAVASLVLAFKMWLSIQGKTFNRED
jgi:hypothetical protein